MKEKEGNIKLRIVDSCFGRKLLWLDERLIGSMRIGVKNDFQE